MSDTGALMITRKELRVILNYTPRHTDRVWKKILSATVIEGLSDVDKAERFRTRMPKEHVEKYFKITIK